MGLDDQNPDFCVSGGKFPGNVGMASLDISVPRGLGLGVDMILQCLESIERGRTLELL